MPKRTDVVMQFGQVDKDATKLIGNKNAPLIRAVLETINSGEAVSVSCPDGWPVEKLRNWFAGSVLRNVDRAGLSMRTRTDREQGRVYVWAIKRAD
jgi:hypothetical protein